MTITFRSRPLTDAETAAGWGAVLTADDSTLKPVYLAHVADVATFPASPMAQLLARVTGATIAVA